MINTKKETMKKIRKGLVRIGAFALCFAVAITMMPLDSALTGLDIGGIDVVYAGGDDGPSEEELAAQKAAEDLARRQGKESQVTTTRYSNGSMNINVTTRSGRGQYTTGTAAVYNKSSVDAFSRDASATITGGKYYALVFDSGVLAPKASDIMYISLAYTNKAGKLRYAYINPQAAYERTLKMADTGLTANATEIGNMTGSKTKSKQVLFESYSQAMLTFAIPYTSGSDAIVGIDSIVIQTNSIDASITWELNSVQLIEDPHYYSTLNPGEFSDKPTIMYSGKLVAQKGGSARAVEEGQTQEGAIKRGAISIEVLKIVAEYETRCVQAVIRGFDNNLSRQVNNYEHNKTYTMNISLADEYMAGIESFNTEFSTGDLALVDSIMAEIHYIDMNDTEQTIQYPVISNAVSMFCSQTGKSAADVKKYYSFAQQGENIPFQFTIPNCSVFTYVVFKYNTNAGTDYEKEYFTTGSASVQHARAFTNTDGDGDYFRITGIQLWDDECQPDSYTTDGTLPVIAPEIKSDPKFYYNAGTAEGVKISKNENFAFVMPDFSQTWWDQTTTDSGNGIYKEGDATSAAITTDPALKGLTTDASKSLAESLKYFKIDLSKSYGLKTLETMRDAAGQDIFLANTLFVVNGDLNVNHRNRQFTEQMIKTFGPGATIKEVNDAYYADTYIFELLTSDVSVAGTSSDVTISVTYINQEGKIVNSPETSLAEMAREFYGYWPGAAVEDEKTTSAPAGYEDGNAGYNFSMGPGNTMKAMVTLNKCVSIEGVTFKVSSEIQDDWQLENMVIHRVQTINRRVMKTLEHNENYGGVITNRQYVRALGASDYSLDVGAKIYGEGETLEILMKPGSTTYIALDGSSLGDEIKQDKNRDISNYMYSLSLEDALKIRDFADVVKSYTVYVDVAANSEKATVTDSCGSANYFYFQLIFEDGNSAYVLGNQQLSGDGFSAGNTESFTVNTNTDMGELTAINIVPDATYDRADPLDRLCIDSISVVKNTYSGIKRKWYVDNVGWIGPEYTDTGDDSTNTGKGHPAGDITFSYPIVDSSYIVTLQFDILTEKVNEGIPGAADEFTGAVTADIKYHDSNGGMHTLSNVDVVKAAYEFAGDQPRLDSSGTYYISDPRYMFVPNGHTRFFVDVDGCTGLDSITFYAGAEREQSLQIKDVDVKIVMGPGRPVATNIKDANGNVLDRDHSEYKMKYTVDPILLTELTGTGIKYILHPQGRYNGIMQVSNTTCKFDTNEIPVITTESVNLATVARVPASKNDTMNIFVELQYSDHTSVGQKDSTKPSQGKYKVKAHLTYQAADCENALNNVVTLAPTDDDLFLYAKGITASRMKSLSSVNLSCDKKDVDVYIKNCVVQQVRSGVVIATYYMNFGLTNLSVMDGGLGSSHAINATEKGRTQEVYIQLTNEVEKRTLVAETYDVAVSLQYTSEKDKVLTKEGRRSVYESPTVFLTDDNVISVGPYTLMHFTFHEPDVDSIEGLKITPTGGLSIKTSRAFAYDYTMSPDAVTGDLTRSFNHYFSFNSPAVADAKSTTMKQTANDYYGSDSVQLVHLDFQTGYTEAGNLGTTEGANIEITYSPYEKDGRVSGTTKTMSFNNIEGAIIGGEYRNFISPDPLGVELLVPNVGQIKLVKITPCYQDPTKTGASWTLDTVAVSKQLVSETEGLYLGDKVTSKVNATITQEEPKQINFSDIKVNLSVAGLQGSATNRTMNVLGEGGKSMKVSVSISGSTTGQEYDVTTYQVSESGSIGSSSNCGTVTNSGSSFTYTPPVVYGTGTKYYMVTVSPKETDAVSASIRVEVPDTPEPVDTEKKN